MARFGKTGMLIGEYDLSGQDFFEYKRDGRSLTIIRRAGMEKIAKQLDIRFSLLNITCTDTRTHPVYIATIVGTRYGSLKNEIMCQTNTSASATPADCIHERFTEIVEARVKDRAILQLADLHEHHIHSEGASADFERASKTVGALAKDNNKKKEDVKPDKAKPKTKHEEIEEIMQQKDKDSLQKTNESLRAKSQHLKRNKDLLK